jgi:ATP-dependent DNA ligase
MSIFSAYPAFRYLWPPRAEHCILPDQLTDVTEGDWLAQPKYNGSCSVLFLNGHTDYRLFNRHNEELTLQHPLAYNQLNDHDSKYMVLCGEYLNKNKKGEDNQPFNHKFVIWDILVHRGTYLLGRPVEWRMNLLYELFGTSRGVITDQSFTLFEHLMATKVKDVFLAPTYTKHFKALYDDLIKTDLYEGIVLKRANAPLELGIRENNNSAWQVKARKQTKNYNF